MPFESKKERQASLRRSRNRIVDGEPVYPTPAEIRSGKTEYPRVGGTYVYGREYYNTGRVYILDEPGHALAMAGRNRDQTSGDDHQTGGAEADDEANQEHNSSSRAGRRRRTESVHDQKCAAVRKFFDEDSVYHVKSVPGLPESGWKSWWTNEMVTWTAGELIIVWRFLKRPYSINAFDFFKKLIAGNADVQLLLECYIPTRYQKRYKLIGEARKSGRNVEIVGTGEPGQDDEGHRKPNLFTDEMLGMFDDVLDGRPKIRSKVSHKAFSVPQLMAYVKELDGNPYRLWLSEYNEPKGGEPPVQMWRMRINPHKVVQLGKLIFHKDCTRDSKKEAELQRAKEKAAFVAIHGPAANFGPNGTDEGFAEESPSDVEEDDGPQDEGLFV